MPEPRTAERAAGGLDGAASWRRSGGLMVDERLERLGVLHGTTTRALGDMADPARRRALFDGMGLKGQTGLILKQVHGDRVVRWSCEPLPAVPSGERSADRASGDCGPWPADGWMAAAPSRPLCVYTADCVPLILWGPASQGRGIRFGGVFHVGWRGAAAGFARKAAEELRRAFAAAPEELCASVGPHVGPCCYQVGAEVSSLFRRDSVVPAGNGTHLDLGAEVASQLREAGLEPGSIAVCPECTCCREDLFFSYRRDKTRDSMMTFLAVGA